MRNFQGYFFRTFQDLKLQLSRSWNFKEKIQDFPGGVGTLQSERMTMERGYRKMERRRIGVENSTGPRE